MSIDNGGQDTTLTLTSDCKTKFRMTKEKAIQEVESQKCVVPSLMENSREQYDRLELQVMCDEKFAVVKQTGKGSIQHISRNNCWEFNKSWNVLVIKADNPNSASLPSACDKEGTEFKFEKGI